MYILYKTYLYKALATLTLASQCYAFPKKRHLVNNQDQKAHNAHIDYMQQYSSCNNNFLKLKALQYNVKKLPISARYDALKAALHADNKKALQLYAHGLNIWPLYKEVLQEGRLEYVPSLLPLMHARSTIPEKINEEKKATEWNVPDCSGLVAVIDSNVLNEDQQIACMNEIINFYTPPRGQNTLKKTYSRNRSSSCKCAFLCNQRRQAFIVYGLAKAGERCIERGSSYKILEYIYKTHKAVVTPHALATLSRQHRTELVRVLSSKSRSKRIDLLTKFGCINDMSKQDMNAPGYYEQVALPVITNLKPKICALIPQVSLCKKV